MSKSQLVCPKCKHEFVYDRGYYDREIARLGREIRDIHLQIAEHKARSWPEQKANGEWYARTKKALAIRKKEIGDLKEFRKAANEQQHRQAQVVFNEVVHEKLGDREYRRLWAEVDERMQPYDIAGTAKAPYSTATGRGVTSINKL